MKVRYIYLLCGSSIIGSLVTGFLTADFSVGVQAASLVTSIACAIVFMVQGAMMRE